MAERQDMSMDMDMDMEVEVAYAEAERQIVLAVRVPAGARARDAVELSGVLERFPRIPWPEVDMGIFGRRVSPCAPLSPGDRVEIYRPLQVDPKEARRLRAARTRRGD